MARRSGGVVLADGGTIAAAAVVIATGTFLGAALFRGVDRAEGGRIGERAAKPLARQLRALGLPVGRLKTGTPPRLDGRTIDWAVLAAQGSDTEGWTMSAVTPHRMLPQIACAITRTTLATHDIIRASLDRSPLFTGAIGASGPRYCPSIEDKVERFGDRDGHPLFLEPEGLDDALVYPNGLSTSLPIDAQVAMVQSIAGLERATITVPGYAVEYDYLDPRSLDATLGMSAIPGLFCAGADQWHDGLRGSGGAGADRRAQRGGLCARHRPGHSRPRFELYRRHDRRSRTSGCYRAISDAHGTCRVPPVPARRQR